MVPSAERRRELARLASAAARAALSMARRRCRPARRRPAVAAHRGRGALGARWRARPHAAHSLSARRRRHRRARAGFRSQPRRTRRCARTPRPPLHCSAPRRSLSRCVERRFREACKGKFQSGGRPPQAAARRIARSGERADPALLARLQALERWYVAGDPPLVQGDVLSAARQGVDRRLRTPRACLGLMLASIERQLLDAAEIADGFGVAAAGGAAAARPHQKGARHLAPFGSVIPPAERERIVNTLLSKVKRDYFGVLQRRAERRRDAENAVFRVDMTSIKAMLHEVGPPDGPPPRVSPRSSQTVRPRDAALASREGQRPAPSPYLAVFSNLREPLTR